MTRRTRRRSATFFAAFISVAMVAAACTPPPPPTVKTWEFKSTQVTVNEANDCVPVPFFGGCIPPSSDTDEAYVLNVAFRVKIGQANSASTWVAGSRSNDTSVNEGQTKTLTGAAQNGVTFSNVSTLDVANLSSNKLEVVGTYTWVMEKDSVGVATAANDVAAILKDALNGTLAQAEGVIDPNLILDLIFDNLGSSFTLLLSNIPLLGLGDDALGGAFYIGIGAKGGLATTLDGLLGSIPPPNFSVPVLALPPDVVNFGVFTMQNTKTFSGQQFDASCLIPQCGIHTYNFQANQV
jgi:hypothetical protein